MKQIAGLPVSDDVAACNPDLQDDINLAQEKPSKYRNAKTEAKGMRFDSGHEAGGVMGLILAEEHKQVFGLRLQVPFPLPGKTTYIADAVYLELEDGKLQIRIVDFKGVRTPAYRIKSRLFKETYGMSIREL